MSQLFPILLPAALGLALAARALKNSRIPHKHFLIGCLAPTLGLGVISLLLFWSYRLASPYGPLTTEVAAWAVMLALLFIPHSQITFRLSSTSKQCDPPREKAGEEIVWKKILTIAAFLVFAIAIFQYGHDAASEISRDFRGGWDARYMWNLKARFYFRDPASWQNMFSPLMQSFSIPDYPLFLPGSVAWGWNWLKHESLIWPCMLSRLFFISVVSIVIWRLWCTRPLWSALLGGTFLLLVPAYRFWSTTQYADIALGGFIATSIFLLAEAIRLQELKTAWLAAFLAGLAGWTKNEGLLFAGLFFIIAITAILKTAAWSPRERKKFVLYVMAGLLLPPLTAIYLKWAMGGPGIYWSSHYPLLNRGETLLNFKKTFLISTYFLSFKLDLRQWYGLWAMFVAALLWSGVYCRAQWRDVRWWMLVAGVLLLDAGYFFIFHISPFDPKTHMGWALIRLFLHHGVLAFVFAFEVFTNRSPAA